MRQRFAGQNLKIGIVCSRFNESITKLLALGAVDACKEAGIAEENIRLLYVPGAFELPQAAQWLMQKGDCDAIVCLGAIIQGDTDHHLHLAQTIFPLLSKLTCKSGIPLGTGILTTSNMEQAMDRAGGKHGNKGVEAACAALEMLELKGNL